MIVGDGLAGASAARTLREEGYDGRITLVGAQPHPPYERPPLSKAYLRGERPGEDAYVEPAGFWAEQEIELLAGTVASRIDLAQGRLELAGGGRLPFDVLLLAPGAAPRTMDMPGAGLDGVLTLRNFEDADAIRTQAQTAERVLIVGGGWIGCEVAASLRVLGCDVTVALRGRLPLERQLGSEMASVYRELHQEHGVRFLPETRIMAFEGPGSVRRARTVSGQWLDYELVVVAIGVVPRTELAAAAGLAVSDGLVVDGRLATSDPRVFAAGDIALAPHADLGRSLRIEHWATALAQGRHAARAMLGAGQSYNETPYLFSDQYETGMELFGDPDRQGELVVRGGPASYSFSAFWHQAGHVRTVLGMHVHHAHGHPDADAHGGGHLDPDTVGRLLRSPRPVPAAALADPHVPLEQLLDAGTPAG